MQILEEIQNTKRLWAYYTKVEITVPKLLQNPSTTDHVYNTRRLTTRKQSNVQLSKLDRFCDESQKTSGFYFNLWAGKTIKDNSWRHTVNRCGRKSVVKRTIFSLELTPRPRGLVWGPNDRQLQNCFKLLRDSCFWRARRMCSPITRVWLLIYAYPA